MAKRPSIRVFDESHLRKINYSSEYPSEPDIPHWIVRALVRGLLTYFSMPRRRRELDDLDLGVLEEALLASSKDWTTSDTTTPLSSYKNEQVLRLTCLVPDIMDSLLAHPSKAVVTEESNRLIPQLIGYDALTGTVARESWLRRNLHAVLASLLHGSRCPLPSCPRRTDVPEDKELKKWAAKNGIREVSFHILAYHHASTYATVKDHLLRCTPRRSPGNRPPR